MTKALPHRRTEHLLLIIFSHTSPLMALSSAKLVCFLFLLTFFSEQIQARESQFFSKVPSSNGNNNVRETVTLPNKEEQSLSKQQQEPTFIPETQNGYGLYGQENKVKYKPYTTPITSTPTGTFEYNTPSKNTVNYEPYTTPTSSKDVKYEPYTTPITSTRTGTFEYNTPRKNTVNYEPYTTPTTSSTYAPSRTKTQTQENYNNYPNNYNNNNNNNKYYYNKDAFETERENTGDSKFQQSGYTNLANQNNYYNGYNNVEKQGMSDTRFMENGKYFYDVQNEKNYYPNQYQQNSRTVVSGNGFNSRGYNANNENSYEYNNSMEGYENEENEFDEIQD